MNLTSRSSMTTLSCTAWPVQYKGDVSHVQVAMRVASASQHQNQPSPEKCFASNICFRSLYCCAYLACTLSLDASVMPSYDAAALGVHRHAAFSWQIKHYSQHIYLVRTLRDLDESDKVK